MSESELSIARSSAVQPLLKTLLREVGADDAALGVAPSAAPLPPVVISALGVQEARSLLAATPPIQATGSEASEFAVRGSSMGPPTDGPRLQHFPAS